MTLLRDAEQTVALAAENTVQFADPHVESSDLLLLWEKGLSKDGPVGRPYKSGHGEVAAAAIIGTLFHHGVEIYHAGLAESELDALMESLYGKRPPIYRGWSEKAQESSPIIDTAQPAIDGYTTITQYETRFSQGRKARLAAKTLFGLLLRDSTATQLSPVLKACPQFLKPEENDGRFDGMVHGLTNFPLQPDEVIQLVDDARPFQFASDKRIAIQPTARVDILKIHYVDDDPEAKQVAEAFASVLGSGDAYDPDKLSRMKFKYGVPGREKEINGIEVMHRAASLMCDQARVILEIVEEKTISHAVNNEDVFLDDLWLMHGDMSNMFSYENLLKDGRFYNHLRSLKRKMFYDAAKTGFALRNVLSTALRENRMQRPNQEVIPLDEVLMPTLRIGVMPIDFNIMFGDLPPKPKDGVKRVLPYKITPSIEGARIPARISTTYMTMEYADMQSYWEKWESELHRRMLGMIAIQRSQQ